MINICSTVGYKNTLAFSMQIKGSLKVYYISQIKTLVRDLFPKSSQHTIIIHVHLFYLNYALVHHLFFEHNTFKCLLKYLCLGCVLQKSLQPNQQMPIDHKQNIVAI